MVLICKVERQTSCSVGVENKLFQCLDSYVFLLRHSRSKVTVFRASVPVAVIRAATLNVNAATATGTAHQGATKRPARRALKESFLARVVLECATQHLSAATTRRGVQMGLTRRTATTASLETFTAGLTCASLRHGGVTARRTA